MDAAQSGPDAGGARAAVACTSGWNIGSIPCTGTCLRPLSLWVWRHYLCWSAVWVAHPLLLLRLGPEPRCSVSRSSLTSSGERWREAVHRLQPEHREDWAPLVAMELHRGTRRGPAPSCRRHVAAGAVAVAVAATAGCRPPFQILKQREGDTVSQLSCFLLALFGLSLGGSILFSPFYMVLSRRCYAPRLEPKLCILQENLDSLSCLMMSLLNWFCFNSKILTLSAKKITWNEGKFAIWDFFWLLLEGNFYPSGKVWKSHCE